jgi:ABC-type sugar transport system substrate-binding protein
MTSTSARTMVAALAVAAAVSAPAASAKGLPTPKASHFGHNSNRVTNAWFPLARGSVYVYEGQKDGKQARDVMTVTRRVKTITGSGPRWSPTGSS